MKKKYQIPATKVVKINIQQMMAGSPGYGGQTTEKSGNLSRRNSSFWEDDEE